MDELVIYEILESKLFIIWDYVNVLWFFLLCYEYFIVFHFSSEIGHIYLYY